MIRSVPAFVRAFVAFLLLFVGANASAVPVIWTLEGVTFVDGGTASGWFVFDADLPGDQQAITDFSISVDGGDTATFPPITYVSANAYGNVVDQGAGDYGAIFSLSAPGETRGIRIPAVSPLTNAGGTLAINPAGAGAGECYNCGPQRSFSGGNLVGSPVVTITSAATTTFVLSQPGSFTVTATGAPPPAISVAGALPPGISFVDNGDGSGTFSGVPTTPGSYALTITASNGVGSPAVQAFTFVVGAPVAATPAPTLGGFGLLCCALLLVAAAARRLVPGNSRQR